MIFDRNTLLIYFLAFLVFILIGGIFLYKDVSNLNCDIGQNETVGDFVVKDHSGNVVQNVFLSKDCAVRDCISFNDYQKSIGGLGYCVV